MDLFQIIASTLELFSLSIISLFAISYGLFKIKDKKKDKNFLVGRKDLAENRIMMTEKSQGKFDRLTPEAFSNSPVPASVKSKSFNAQKFQVCNKFSELSSINFR